MKPKNKSPLGAINDLTIAAEFLLCAVRDLAAGDDLGSDEVQRNIDFALRKFQHLKLVPLAGHIGARKGSS